MANQEKVALLLVDDVPSNLLALSAILDRPDYNLVTATSGQNALDLLGREEFALVLLDVMMPGMDGYEVASRMKQSENLRYVPILFVTAIATDLKDIYKGYSVGGVDYIQKPLEPDVVRAKVAVFVELFRQRHEIERQAELIRNSERAPFLERERAARLRAEDAERRFRNLVNALDHAIIWEAAPDLSKFSFVSERVEALLGYPRSQWLEELSFFINHVHPEDRPRVLKSVETTLKGRDDGLGERCDHRMLGADGRERWFHTGLQEERDKQGNPFRLRGLCVDIGPLKKVEQDLRDAVQAREEIVSVVAHDLKNPLTAADLNTTLLIQSAENEDMSSVKQQAGRIKNAIGRTLKLTEDILDVGKVEAGRFVIESHEEDAGDIIKSVVEILTPLAFKKSIKLQIEIGAQPCSVMCDRNRVQQVLSNLIGNAIKFTPEHGEIWVRAEPKDGDVLFSVHDTGPGLSPDQALHVFERYWQAGKTRAQGTGLGLTISKGIVEAHGGKIWAESELGKGSTFFFTLRRSEAFINMEARSI